MNDDFADTSILTDKARQLHPWTQCEHGNATLVQHIHAEFGWFACHQCDDCGAITQRTVTADDLDMAINAPLLDVTMYMQATKERLPGQATINTLAFFGKATR